MADLASGVKALIDDIDTAWAECKKLKVDFSHVVSAVDDGLTIPEALAVIREAVRLPGGATGIQAALRIYRATRKATAPATPATSAPIPGAS